MILAYACDIRMSGVFKPKQIKYEIEWKMINVRNCIYVHAYLLNRLKQKGLEKRNRILCPTNRYTFTALFG